MLEGACAAVIVTPSSIMRDVADRLAGLVGEDFPVIVCSKGVEEGSGLLPVIGVDRRHHLGLARHSPTSCPLPANT